MLELRNKNGSLIEMHTLLKCVPLSIFESRNHVETCLVLSAERYAFEDSRKKLYVNLLMTSSLVARYITAIWFLVCKGSRHDFSLLKLPCNIYSLCDWDVFFDKKLTVCSDNTALTSFLNKPKFLNLFLKVLGHRCYRLLGFLLHRKVKRSGSIVRCYVEVTERLFREQMRHSLCVFFPFPLKWTRQFAFYKYCRAKGYDVAVSGIPYSFKEMWAIYVGAFRDDKLLGFEYSAYKKHGQELSQLDIVAYYTEDDYIPASFLVADELKENGCHVTHMSHGVGQRIPYVSATSFYVLTQVQKKCYETWSHHKILNLGFQKLNLSLSKAGNYKEVKFIFIHQNFEDNNIAYEGSLQRKIIASLERLSQSTQTQVYIKWHPNTQIHVDTRLATCLDFPSDSSTLNVCLTLNSTTYYTRAQFDLFIFIGDDLCNPYDMMEDNLLFYHVENLNQIISLYSDVKTAVLALERQIQLLSVGR